MNCCPQRRLCHAERSEAAEVECATQSFGAPRAFGPFASLRVTSFLSVLLLFACASPEAGRQPGAAGADIKNWGQPVELHAGAQPYHNTPCAEQIECKGPQPVFGPTPPPD